MAKDDKPHDLMNYDALAQDALRGVVRASLKRAAQPKGLPGDHHFYISFRTDAAGVSAPPELLDKYPDEMTIVLQNDRFRELAPGETFFSVTLAFGGQPKALSIPYSAVTRFYDPSVQFLLQFEPGEPAAEPEKLTTAKAPTALPSPKAKPALPRATASRSGAESDAPPSGEPAKVVSLDQFRKK